MLLAGGQLPDPVRVVFTIPGGGLGSNWELPFGPIAFDVRCESSAFVADEPSWPQQPGEIALALVRSSRGLRHGVIARISRRHLGLCYVFIIVAAGLAVAAFVLGLPGRIAIARKHPTTTGQCPGICEPIS
jgi:hypothetical protein